MIEVPALVADPFGHPGQWEWLARIEQDTLKKMKGHDGQEDKSATKMYEPVTPPAGEVPEPREDPPPYPMPVKATALMPPPESAGAAAPKPEAEATPGPSGIKRRGQRMGPRKKTIVRPPREPREATPYFVEEKKRQRFYYCEDYNWALSEESESDSNNETEGDTSDTE